MALQTPMGAPPGLKVSARNVAAAGGWGTGAGRDGGVSAHPQCSLEEGLVSSLSPRDWATWGNNGGWWGWWMVVPMCPGGSAEDQALPSAREAGLNRPKEAMPVPSVPTEAAQDGPAGLPQGFSPSFPCVHCNLLPGMGLLRDARGNPPRREIWSLVSALMATVCSPEL